MSLWNKRLSRDPYAPLKSPLLAVRMPRWRSRLVLALMIVGFGALALRALWVQVIDRDFYTAQGQKRYQLTLPLDATRGRIVDRHGALLAVSVATYEIWATPGLVKPQTVAPLAKLLDMPVAELERRLAPHRGFVLLKRQIDEETATRIETLGGAGITRVASEKRVYPEGESVAQIVGFTDLENNGLEGVELALNDALKGNAGQREVVRDRLGRFLYDARPITPARHGDTIRLTIDRRIQQLAYTQLEAAIKQHQAKAGSVVVLDARGGEILAMANWPTFDPNDRAARVSGQVRNRALTDTFEPGSTIKPMIVALALDAGKVRPDTLIDTSPGTYRIGRNVIHDTSNHGMITVAQAVQKSSNVAMAKLALSLPAEAIWSKYQEYGFGHPPAITFPGAAPGKLRPYKHWVTIDQATHAYGYGLSMSLMQVAQAYTAFAGDGVMKPAKLVIRDEPDTAVAGHRAVTTPDTAASIRAMLEMAVGPGGTARAAMIDSYRAGGKTGTVRKLAGTSYAKDKYRALFVGMAPMSDPRVIVAVMIDEPAGRSFYGGSVAGPVFAAVTGESLQMLGVPPDATPLLSGTSNDASA
ncbi:penicillin-binding protein 2 [Mycetohabitans rhizoxinica]|uniref:Peptidoglycan D,D-transpeptidase FtsI n=1 Tax=Mycetohabitans rhizoxinica TaxID=412963 RepID=A0ABZ2Q3U4_9BURK